MKRLNCWEFKKCGRQPKGEHVHDLGICPAATESKLHGVHHGVNAGRACWVVSGTFCNAEVQGTFAKKFNNCYRCDFYTHVKEQEAPKFKLSAVLLSHLG